MNTATRHSERTRTATGRLLGVLGVFWLNLVLAPCALSFAEEHDCPHCPPEQMQEMAAHHGQHREAAGSGCDAVMPGCDDIGTYAHEGRLAQPKLKDKAEPVAIAPSAFPQASLDIARFVTTAADPPEPDRFSPALHLLNCVFLD